MAPPAGGAQERQGGQRRHLPGGGDLGLWDGAGEPSYAWSPGPLEAGVAGGTRFHPPGTPHICLGRDGVLVPKGAAQALASRSLGGDLLAAVAFREHIQILSGVPFHSPNTCQDAGITQGAGIWPINPRSEPELGASSCCFHLSREPPLPLRPRAMLGDFGAPSTFSHYGRDSYLHPLHTTPSSLSAHRGCPGSLILARVLNTGAPPPSTGCSANREPASGAEDEACGRWGHL